MVWITGICRGFLSALFLVACVGKFEKPREVLGTVMDFKVVPGSLAPLVAATLPGVELALGLILLFAVLSPPFRGGWRDTVAAAEWLMLLLLVVMTATLAQAMLRGIEMGCGCFDFLARYIPVLGANKITWGTVARDVVFVLPAAWLVRRQR